MIILVFVLLPIVAIYTLVHYRHVGNKNNLYISNMDVISGFVLVGATVPIVPLNVANNEWYFG